MRHPETLDLPFAGEMRPFFLGLAQWRAIQAKCDAGPPEIAARLAPVSQIKHAEGDMNRAAAMGLLGRWRIDDIRETLLQGLIGGGENPSEATLLVMSTFDSAAPLEYAGLAYQLIMHSIIGPEDEPIVGEPQPAKKTSRRSRAAKSASPGSTPPRG